MRKTPFITNQYYHIFNRGVDKRQIFSDIYDLKRFMQSMAEFNTIEPIGSIYENKYKLGHRMSKSSGKLVEFICYCLNPNHYHFILKQITDKGIEKLLQKIGNGYTKYYNNKHKRSGVLFQGKFKSVHIKSNDQLLHASIYVNLNFRIHKIDKTMLKIVKSSWPEYIGDNKDNLCDKKDILSQFKNSAEYKDLALNILNDIIERKEEIKNFEY